MAVRIQRQVQQPPAYLIDRFYQPMSKVALTWAAVARALAKKGYDLEITSWWRPQWVNSQHLVGTAIDALSPRLTRAQLLPLVQRAAKLYGASAPTKPSETSGRSVHVQGLPFGTVATLMRQEPNLLRTAGAFVGPPRPVA